MKISIKMLLVMLLAVTIAAAGCGGEKKAEQPPKDGLRVVTSFYPMYVAAINIAKDVDGVTVTNMTKPQTGCLHDYQLTTEDMKTLEKADIFIVNGAGMESFLDKAVKQQPELKVVEASRGIRLLEGSEGPNPHIWVSVSGAIEQVRNIAEQLAALDEKHSDKYRQNAAAYIKRLEELRDDMHKTLDGLPNRKVITFHEAFPYFAQEFNLTTAAVIEREPGSEPSPQELKETIDLVKTSGVKALFAEPQYSAASAETIASESGAKVYYLDPVVTGEADSSAYDAYINIMQQNKAVLKEALQ